MRFEKFVSNTYTSITSVHDKVQIFFDRFVPKDKAGAAHGKAIK